jgi:glycosyltransferase involved in cell wall biosynthesis
MKVSIITVTLNSAKTIKDCIVSVNSQTFSNIEHIIVDGGSKDNTIDIIRSMPGRVVRLVSEPDKGMYDAMNKGINMATGDIIGILNSDDFFSSANVITKVAEVFEKNGIEAVYGDVHFVHPDNLNKCVRYYSSGIFKPSLFRFGFMLAHPSFYMKKDCYEKYGLYSVDYTIASDYDLLIRYLYSNKVKTKYIKMDFVTMRTGGISNRNFRSRITLNKEIVMACRKYGIYTNLFMVSLKYFYKIFELRRSKG